MTKSELIQFAEAKGAKAKEKNLEGRISISIFVNPIIGENTGINGFRNAIFIKKVEDRWVIGFSQATETRLLTDEEIKDIIGIWIDKPDDKIFRKYENT